MIERNKQFTSSCRHRFSAKLLYAPCANATPSGFHVPPEWALFLNIVRAFRIVSRSLSVASNTRVFGSEVLLAASKVSFVTAITTLISSRFLGESEAQGQFSCAATRSRRSATTGEFEPLSKSMRHKSPTYSYIVIERVKKK